MTTSTDKRAITRLSCALRVSRLGQSSSWGEFEDISLDGFYLRTAQPLPVGTVVPLVVRLHPEDVDIRPFAQVVRHTDDGLGAKFVKIGDADRRRLRRFVTELNTVTNRRRAADLALAEGSETLSVQDPARIRDILLAAAGPKQASDPFVLVPKDSDARLETRLEQLDGADLWLAGSPPAVPKTGDQVLVLCTSHFASYSFFSKVAEVMGNRIRLPLPASIHYANRRSLARRPPDAQQTISLAIPWQNNELKTWPVHDRGQGGLSFRAELGSLHFWPGTALPNMVLRGPSGHEEVLTNVVVKHLSPMALSGPEPWLKVGLSFGVERGAVEASAAPDSEASSRANALSTVVSRARMLGQRASYLFYKYGRSRGGTDGAKAPAFTVVRFPNATKKPIVALMNRAFSEAQKTPVPVVIVTPGFAGRKETFSQLATTLIHNFRRQHQDLVVLRLDGSNNLGESYKDPGAEEEGKHTMRFTLSGVIQDILGAVAWARRNPHFIPSHIVLLSSSFSAISARRAMTLPELADVGLWIALMGPPDGAHPIANAMGNSDPYKNFLEGVPNGMLTMFGCLADGDNVCRDMHEHQLATLESARADMANIRGDVVWVVGKHDAFIDPQRVKDVMTVKAAGARRMLSVDSGHLPRSSEQAIAQFRLLSEVVWKHIHRLPLETTAPPAGLLASLAEDEWRRVRRAHPQNDSQYWRRYLVGDGKIGYDIWSVTPEYQQLIADQTRLLNPGGRRLLDLGAGTGNAAAAAAAAGPASIVAMDLVADALERTRTKVAAFGVPVTTRVASADGSVRTAMRRWLAGDLHQIGELIVRLPAGHARALAPLVHGYTRSLHGILRGGCGSTRDALDGAGLRQELAPFLEDLRILAQWERGIITPAAAQAQLGDVWADASLVGQGIPFPTGAFDRVISSLVISYLSVPEDMLAEVYRVLAPDGVFVMSTLLPDTEGSQNYLNAINAIETAPAHTLPPGYSRQELLDAAHQFLDRACDLVRLEEEGLFQFFSGPQLAEMAQAAGFVDVTSHASFGTPAQAAIVACRKP